MLYLDIRMPRKARTYNLNSKIRSALRKVWQWSPMRSQALKAARIGINQYKCAECSAISSLKQVAVDHISPCGSIDDLNAYKQRLFHGELQVLCKEPCHKAKTASERRRKS